MAKGKLNLTHTLTLAAGGVVGGFVGGNKVAGMVPFVKDNEKLHGALPIVGGIILKMLVKKSPMVQTLADGMIVAGAVITVGKLVPALSIGGVYADPMADQVAEALAASAQDAIDQAANLVSDEMGEEMNEEMNADPMYEYVSEDNY